MIFGSVHVVKRPGTNDTVDLCANSLIETATNRLKIPVIESASDIQNDTLVVAIGGDGTMLEAMRRAVQMDATTIGINVGRVGFLTDINLDGKPGSIDPRTLWSFFYFLIMGDLRVYEERRTLLKRILPDDVPPQLAINEFSISRTGADCMIEYHLQIDKFDGGIHRANSILFSTSTGSTAYALSAGGVLMMPSLHAIQIVPVAPMTLTSRPLIVDPNRTIKVAVWADGLSLRGDGNILLETDNVYTKESPAYFGFQAHPVQVRILHLESWDFFEVLHQKLGWIKNI